MIGKLFKLFTKDGWPQWAGAFFQPVEMPKPRPVETAYYVRAVYGTNHQPRIVKYEVRRCKDEELIAIFLDKKFATQYARQRTYYEEAKRRFSYARPEIV